MYCSAKFFDPIVTFLPLLAGSLVIGSTAPSAPPVS
jgi:hypothetical protein